MKKIIISQRLDFIEYRNEVRDSLDIRLIALLEECNLIPIPMPNNIDLSFKRNWLDSVEPAGIILSGGNNLNEFTNHKIGKRSCQHMAFFFFLIVINF